VSETIDIMWYYWRSFARCDAAVLTNVSEHIDAQICVGVYVVRPVKCLSPQHTFYPAYDESNEKRHQ